jgi:NADP-dependent 3-hydroxy acid dehydrogenase YdfG
VNRGLGRGGDLRLTSAAGYSLLLLARRLEAMEALELPNCLCEKVDVGDLKAVEAAVVKAEAKFGPSQVLVNNAGLMCLSSLHSQDPAEWEAMYNVNVRGLMNTMKVVIPGMRERTSGTIINVSSIAGHKAFDSHAAYCGTKFAVDGITETVRQENAAFGVRVCLVSPGVVETELLGHTSDKKIIDDYDTWKKEGLKSSPLQASEVADAILYVAQAPPHVCIRDIRMAPTFQQA